MNIMAVVKEHPVPIGIGVVVILLIVFARGSNGATSSNAGAFLQAQSIAAQSNNQLAEITTRGNIALGQQSVERSRIAMDAATARTGAVSSLFATMVGTNAQVRMNTDNNSVKTQQLMANSNMNALETNAQLSVARDTIAAGIRTSSDKLNAMIRMNENDNNTKLNALGMETSGNLALLQKRGEFDLMALDKQIDLSIKTLPAMLQHAETMLNIQGTNAQGLARIMIEPDLLVAKANQDKIRTDAANSVSKEVRQWFPWARNW
jgi:hypothetical protein